MPKISVIIPIYNAEAHLKKCITSICNQTLVDIEIICVNDGSTDNSLEILNALSKEDSRIIVLNQNNNGAGSARNKGLEIATGKYLSFLDADDFFELDMLEKAFNRAEEVQADLIVFKADFYHENTNTFSPCIYNLRESLLPNYQPFSGVDIEKDVFKVIVGWAWDKLFLADFIRKNNLYFQEQRTSNDLLFVFSAFVKAKRIATVPKVLIHQRRNITTSLSVTREKSWSCFYNALLALRAQLLSWDLYDRFESDYINYALHFSLWNLNTLKEPEKKLLYNKLRSEWFDELGISKYPKENFYHKGEYAQYEFIIKYPYSRFLQAILAKYQRGMNVIRRLLNH